MNERTRPALMIAMMVVQVGCILFFVSDVVHDAFTPMGVLRIDTHLVAEAIATLALIFGIAVEARYLVLLLRRAEQMKRSMQAATGALGEVIETYFRDWSLTKSEADVAMFAIKGLTNAEIARLRASSEGTIKAHLNAVFRKAGVSGRHQLVSLLVEDLMAEPLVVEASHASR